MPTLAQGEARTIIVNPSGPPSNTLTAVLPPGVTISLESVLAAIDASGAGDTTATLSIADSSGAVIARKAQGQVVDGGAVGSATWALRLDDEQSGVAPATGIQFNFDNQGGYLDVATHAAGPTGGGLHFIGDHGTFVNDTGGVFIHVTGFDSYLDLANAACTLRSARNLIVESTDDLVLLADNGNIKARPFVSGKSFQILDHAGAKMFEMVSGATAPFDKLGAFGAAAAVQQTVTGSRGGNAALASLLTALANYGLIIDGTTP